MRILRLIFGFVILVIFSASVVAAGQTGSSNAGMLLAELTVANGAYLGHSVAIDGDTIVVGARSDKGDSSGAAYVFVKPSSGWTNMTQTATLSVMHETGNEDFGSSVAIHGNTIVVGSPRNRGRGAAYVFVKPKEGWRDMTQSAKLTSSTPKLNDLFGASVSITNNTVVVGAPGVTKQQGAVYVFVNSGKNWRSAVQAATLTASDVVEGKQNELGYSVAIEGNTIVAGAPDNSFPDGAAYMFVEPGGGWTNATEDGKLIGLTGGAMGYSVSISDDTVVVGGIAYDSFHGATELFVKPASGWTGMVEPTSVLVTAVRRVERQEDGFSVCISQNTVVVGAPQTEFSYLRKGAAYIYRMPAGGWKAKQEWYANTEFMAPDGKVGDEFGYSVSASGTTIVVGALEAEVNGLVRSGKVYVFRR
jgi:uncharacterized protein (DUF2345 family)